MYDLDSIQYYLTSAKYFHWNIDPEFFSLGPVKIRWYGLAFASSFLFGFLLLRRIFRLEGRPVKNLEKLLVYVLIGTILGARLGHCFFYNPSYFLGNPIEILKVWKGGLASHGGGLGALIAIFLYSRNKPQSTGRLPWAQVTAEPYLWLLDRIAIDAALCGFFIRIGNLFNSEIIGTPTTLPWAFIFEKVDNIPRHPVQLYESVTYGLIFVVLLTIYTKQRHKVKQGFLTGLFLLLVFTARFFLEFVKARQASYSSNLPFSVGQLLSIPFLLAGIVLITHSYRKQLSHLGGACNNEPG
ncbi:MAG: prolipoprotein diacylglyceryl transferase [Sedimentisphaerales bacterium]